MKVGKSYVANYHINGLYLDCQSQVATYDRLVKVPIAPGTSFLVVESSDRNDDSNEKWYRIIAPDVMGWLFLREDQDAVLDVTGFIKLDKPQSGLYEVRELKEIA